MYGKKFVSTPAYSYIIAQPSPFLPYSKPLVTPESSYQPVKIDQEQFSKLGTPSAYGTPVTAEEPGYGRVNPFSPYKPPTTPPAAAAGVAATSGTAPAPATPAQ